MTPEPAMPDEIYVTDYFEGYRAWLPEQKNDGIKYIHHLAFEALQSMFRGALNANIKLKTDASAREADLMEVIADLAEFVEGFSYTRRIVEKHAAIIAEAQAKTKGGKDAGT